MKTIKATGKYAVSFNTQFGDLEVGDSGMNTIDFAGDDIDALAMETIEDDPSFPLIFERVEDYGHIIGLFKDASCPDDVYAVMVLRSVM